MIEFNLMAATLFGAFFQVLVRHFHGLITRLTALERRRISSHHYIIMFYVRLELYALCIHVFDHLVDLGGMNAMAAEHIREA